MKKVNLNIFQETDFFFHSTKCFQNVYVANLLKLVCNSEKGRAVVDERGTDGCQNERIDTNEWFNNFEPDAKPDDTEDGADREVEEVVAEVIRLVSDFTNASV